MDNKPNAAAPALPVGAFTQAEFVDAMKIGRTTFFREVQAGTLKCFKIGRRWYISYEAAAEWLRAKEQAGGIYSV